MALPGNTFLHKILPTPEWQPGDLWGSLLQKTSPGVAWPVEFIREFGSNERNQPVTFLVEFKKHKHWGRERPRGRGEGRESLFRVAQSPSWGFLAPNFWREGSSWGFLAPDFWRERSESEAVGVNRGRGGLGGGGLASA